MKVLVFPVLLGAAIYSARFEPPKATRWTGTIGTSTQGDKISFDVAADGKTISNLTFEGHCRCGGQLEPTTVSPKRTFSLQNGQVDGTVVEPPKDGFTSRRYEFAGHIGPEMATGTFRLSIKALGCDTEQLQWTAAPAN